MSGIFAIINDNIVYPELLYKNNGLVFTPSEEALWTPYGRYFPLSHGGLVLLEYLEDPNAMAHLSPEVTYDTYAMGILATPNGKLYEYLISPGGYVTRRLIPRGKGLKYCRSGDAYLEEAMSAAMECSDQLVDNINLVAKSRKLLVNAYKHTTLANVYAEMAKRKITSQPPMRAWSSL